MKKSYDYASSLFIPISSIVYSGIRLRALMVEAGRPSIITCSTPFISPSPNNWHGILAQFHSDRRSGVSPMRVIPRSPVNFFSPCSSDSASALPFMNWMILFIRFSSSKSLILGYTLHAFSLSSA